MVSKKFSRLIRIALTLVLVKLFSKICIFTERLLCIGDHCYFRYYKLIDYMGFNEN